MSRATRARARALAEAVPPRWAVIGRPFGYVAVATTWLAISLVATGAGFFLLGYAIAPHEMPFSEVMERTFGSIYEIVAFTLTMPLLVLVLPGMCWYLPVACWSNAVLACVYVVRSLRPSYGREKLSRTMAATGTLGPSEVSGVALSLLPVRQSRFTRTTCRFYASAWVPDGGIYRAMLPFSVAYVLWVGVASWPTRGVALALWGIPLGALSIWTIVLLVRAWRTRFNDDDPP